MIIKLEGKDMFFLFFNMGYDYGVGNLFVVGDVCIIYFWYKVLICDSLMDILVCFIYLDVEEKMVVIEKGIKCYCKELMIFLCYYQLDVVCVLIDYVQVYGLGYNYLIQYFVGFGKLNLIVWLVYCFFSLYDVNNEKIFYLVVVIIDWCVLD